MSHRKPDPLLLRVMQAIHQTAEKPADGFRTIDEWAVVWRCKRNAAREYVITTAHGQTTPAPWANVLANPHFGSVVSESGPVYTWAENAHEFRLTPWSNDLVCDSSGEAFFI